MAHIVQRTEAEGNDHTAKPSVLGRPVVGPSGRAYSLGSRRRRDASTRPARRESLRVCRRSEAARVALATSAGQDQFGQPHDGSRRRAPGERLCWGDWRSASCPCLRKRRLRTGCPRAVQNVGVQSGLPLGRDWSQIRASGEPPVPFRWGLACPAVPLAYLPTRSTPPAGAALSLC
jgi:hypothetical protein